MNDVFKLVGLVVFVMLWIAAASESDNEKERSREQFGTMMQKVDDGKELTAFEQQRLYDITVGWCQPCNTAKGICKHK